MKLHELAKELGIKTYELSDLAKKLGYGDEYKGISKEIDDEVAEILREGFFAHNKAENDEKNFVEENSKVKLIGMYYDDKTKNYQVAEIDIELKHFLDLGGKLGQKHSTVYNARMDFEILKDRKKGITSPNPLQTRRK